MEGAMGTVVPAGLPKADSLPHYSHDKALPISRTYFYSLSGQDALDFPSPWGPSKACVRNGSSPGIHSPVTEGSITIPAIYRPENVSFPADSGHSAVQQELAAKQRLQAYYASSSKEHSPRAAGIMSPVGIPKTISGGSGMSSTAAESCAGLAIPKPVYGLSPCCAERGCTAGHNYGIEQGLHRMSPRMYEDEWSAHFSHLAYLHKNGQEPLAPQRVLQLDRGGEGMALKDSKTEGYHGISSDRTRRSLPVMEPGHSGYTYNAAHPFIASTPEYCQRIPIPPQMYKGLPITYEPMTLTHRGVPSKVYPDRPGIPKFTQIPPCSIIYYPQSSTEAYRADPHVVTDKQAHHMGQFNSSQHDFNNMSNSCSPRHPLITSFATHHPYGVHFNANPAALHNRPRFPMHQSERPLDFSVRRVQTPDSPRELCRQSGTSGAFHPTPAHYRCLNSPAAERSTLDQSEKSGTGLRIDGCKEFSTISKSHDNVYIKEHRHHISDHSDRDSLSKRHKEECETTTEIEMPSKKRKTTTTHEHLGNSESPSSPPMPVINKVFSLAPYKVYFEATGLFSPPGLSKSPNPQSEDTQVKQEPEIQNSASESNSGENDLSLRQKAQASLGNSRASVEIPETVKIKKEKLDPDETSYQSEMKASIVEEMNHQTHNSEVKERQGELNSSMFDSVQSQIVIKSDCEEESKPPLVEISLSSAISKTEHDVKDGVESVPASMLSSRTPVPSLTPMTKFSLNKIPPHCLKLSNYKIVLPKALKAPVNETVDIPQSPVESKPTIASSKHARHQFMELHQSLCRLVYNRVTHTSCQDLRDWLSKLNLLESASYPNKTQKVSYLLGSKIRDVWLKGEEMVKALQKVVRQLNNYVESCECPFPHVMRAGAVFIPMLVVKEVLFPQVQGTFIDQVLQEHRVELRPTTLSEERQLTQLHRKAFSSKLRRLLSLKHLPDIYPDVLNLLYHAHVCKFLDSTASDGGQKLPRSRNQLNQDREYGQFR